VEKTPKSDLFVANRLRHARFVSMK